MAALTIHSIELSNFMCHQHFLLSFTKRITCIAGRNGTGKSAVMIALGVIFGQRAHALERGNSFAGLIRTGCNQAVIRVVINNHMKIAVEKYGTEITIEKKLRAKGSRLTFLKNGRPMNMSAQELQNLLDSYGLKFENPLNFLTQEKSKKFLMTAGPEELYDYYYRGSGFKTINEELNESLSILGEMETKLVTTAEEYERINEELNEKQENLKFLSTDYEASLKNLEVEEMVLRLKEAIGDVDKFEEDIIKNEERENELRLMLASKNEELNEMRFVPKSTAAVDAEINELHLKERSVVNDCAEYVKEKSEAEAAIQAIKARCKLKEYREELASKSVEIARAEEDISSLEKRDSGLAQKAEAEKSRNEELHNKKYAITKQISFLKVNLHDAQTKQLIEQYGKVKAAMSSTNFKDEVIGPLCDYIVLKDQRWHRPASIVLKRSLSSFIVFNRQDRQLLNEIFRRAGVNFPVSLLSSKKVVSGLKTVENSLLGVLELRRDIVLNQLVMFHNVEQIMLVERREDAYRIIKNGSVDRNKQVIECAYTLDGDKVKLTNGSLSDYKTRDIGRYWFEDNSSKIKSLEQVLNGMSFTNAAQEELHKNGEILRKTQEYRRELDNAKRELEARIASVADMNENNTESYEKKLAGLKRNIDNLQSKLIAYQAELEAEKAKKNAILEENSSGQRNMAMMRRECSREMEHMEIEMAQVEVTRNGLLSEMRGLKNRAYDRFMRITERCKEGNDEVLDSQTENNRNAGNEPRRKVVVELSQRKSAENDGSGDPLYSTDGKSSTKNASTKQKASLSSSFHGSFSDSEEEYRGYYSRLPPVVRDYLKTERTIMDIHTEKKAIRGCIQRTKRLKSRDEIKNEIEALANERELCRRIRERYETSTKEIISACERRFTKRDEIKNRKTAEASELFREFTTRGGYEGSLVFDHENGKLDLRMKVHQSEIAGSKSTLSGGERSFAGVCFLLSLWRSFCCPVKILDEFDVFMDAINRKTAIRTLFDFFKKNEMQVILITPLSTEELVDNDCEIRILCKEEGN